MELYYLGPSGDVNGPVHINELKTWLNNEQVGSSIRVSQVPQGPFEPLSSCMHIFKECVDDSTLLKVDTRIVVGDTIMLTSPISTHQKDEFNAIAPPTEAESGWKYKDGNGTELGPFSGTHMRELFQQGQLDPTTLLLPPNAAHHQYAALSDLFSANVAEAFIAAPRQQRTRAQYLNTRRSSTGVLCGYKDGSTLPLSFGKSGTTHASPPLSGKPFPSTPNSFASFFAGDDKDGVEVPPLSRRTKAARVKASNIKQKILAQAAKVTKHARSNSHASILSHPSLKGPFGLKRNRGNTTSEPLSLTSANTSGMTSTQTMKGSKSTAHVSDSNGNGITTGVYSPRLNSVKGKSQSRTHSSTFGQTGATGAQTRRSEMTQRKSQVNHDKFSSDDSTKLTKSSKFSAQYHKRNEGYSKHHENSKGFTKQHQHSSELHSADQHSSELHSTDQHSSERPPPPTAGGMPSALHTTNDHSAEYFNMNTNSTANCNVENGPITEHLETHSGYNLDKDSSEQFVCSLDDDNGSVVEVECNDEDDDMFDAVDYNEKNLVQDDTLDDTDDSDEVWYDTIETGVDSTSDTTSPQLYPEGTFPTHSASHEEVDLVRRKLKTLSRTLRGAIKDSHGAIGSVHSMNKVQSITSRDSSQMFANSETISTQDDDLGEHESSLAQKLAQMEEENAILRRNLRFTKDENASLRTQLSKMNSVLEERCPELRDLVDSFPLIPPLPSLTQAPPLIDTGNSSKSLGQMGPNTTKELASQSGTVSTNQQSSHSDQVPTSQQSSHSDQVPTSQQSSHSDQVPTSQPSSFMNDVPNDPSTPRTIDSPGGSESSNSAATTSPSRRTGSTVSQIVSNSRIPRSPRSWRKKSPLRRGFSSSTITSLSPTSPKTSSHQTQDIGPQQYSPISSSSASLSPANRRRIAADSNLISRSSGRDLHDHNGQGSADGEDILRQYLVLEFNDESPMLARQTYQLQEEFDAMRIVLKRVGKGAKGFCAASTADVEAGFQLSNDLTQDDVFHLSPILAKFGDAMRDLTTAKQVLVETMETDFISPIESFVKYDIKEALNMRRELERHRDVFETLESKYMHHRRTKDRGVIAAGRSLQRSHDAVEDSLLAEYQTARARFELARFENTRRLNLLEAKRNFQVIQSAAFGLTALLDFFREGYQLLAGLAPELEMIKSQTKVDQGNFETLVAQWRKKRLELESQLHRGAFPFMSKERRQQEMDNPPEKVKVLSKGARSAVPLHEGYLYKRSSGVRKDWKRRWFVLRMGKLFYYRGWKDPVAHEICDIVLCTVREVQSVELRCCFEIISPNKRSYMLQAINETDMNAWVDAIRSATERQLMQQMGRPSLTRTSGSMDPEVQLLRSFNNTCADCDALDPSWVSISLGAVICITCSGVHRSLGTHVSKVRSLALDRLPRVQVQLMRRLGNSVINNIWEANLPSDVKPIVGKNQTGTVVNLGSSRHAGTNSPTCSKSQNGHNYQGNGTESAACEQYIRNKYEKRLYVAEWNGTTEELQNKLFQAVLDDDLAGVLFCVAQGVSLESTIDQTNEYTEMMELQQEFVQGSTCLHVAAKRGFVIMCEYLFQNGCSLRARNDAGDTPAWVAQQSEQSDVVDLLAQHQHSGSVDIGGASKSLN